MLLPLPLTCLKGARSSARRLVGWGTELQFARGNGKGLIDTCGENGGFGLNLLLAPLSEIDFGEKLVVTVTVLSFLSLPTVQAASNHL